MTVNRDKPVVLPPDGAHRDIGPEVFWLSCWQSSCWRFYVSLSCTRCFSAHAS